MNRHFWRQEQRQVFPWWSKPNIFRIQAVNWHLSATKSLAYSKIYALNFHSTNIHFAGQMLSIFTSVRPYPSLCRMYKSGEEKKSIELIYLSLSSGKPKIINKYPKSVTNILGGRNWKKNNYFLLDSLYLTWQVDSQHQNQVKKIVHMWLCLLLNILEFSFFFSSNNDF